MQNHEAIILAGGYGTRLRKIITDVPKPLAPVAGIPFLCYLIERLQKEQYTHIVLATGFLHEQIENYFHDDYHGVKIDYSRELTPLGTGGAIVNALQKCNLKHITILNGDSLFCIPHKDYINFAENKKSRLTLAVLQVNDTSRFGRVTINTEARIISFEEKNAVSGPGLINGGIYRIDRTIFDSYPVNTNFSLEKELLQQDYSKEPFYAYVSNSYFIDIGIPSDYIRAQKELPLL